MLFDERVFYRCSREEFIVSVGFKSLLAPAGDELLLNFSPGKVLFCTLVLEDLCCHFEVDSEVCHVLVDLWEVDVLQIKQLTVH